MLDLWFVFVTKVAKIWRYAKSIKCCLMSLPLKMAISES